MAGVKALRKICLGREVDAGTNVATTTIWRGTGVLDDGMDVQFPDEDIGILGGADRSYIASYLGMLAMDPVPATFEQILHIFEAGVKSVGTGVADGVGTGKVYAYGLPTTSVNTPKTYSIEGGDNQQAEEMSYAFVESFALSGAPKGAVMMAANWQGRQVSPTTFTAGATLPTVEEIVFGKGKLYIDAVSGTIGATQVENTFLGFDLNVKTGFIPVFSGDGQLYFTFVKQVKPEVVLNVTFEHDASAVAEVAKWRAGTPSQVRLEFEGSALGTPGKDYTYKTLLIDLAGKWKRFEKIGESDGNDVRAGQFIARYNSTAALFGSFTVVNELATVP